MSPPSNGIELPLELLGKLGMTPKDTLDEERLIETIRRLARDGCHA